LNSNRSQVLIGGGLSLGTAVDSSGLLLTVGGALEDQVGQSGATVALLAFSSLVAVLANFISSTVAAVILLPLIAQVGSDLGSPKTMVALCAFMTSGAMGLPVSSFPNSMMFSTGNGLLTNRDFIKTGFPICALVLLMVNTLGHGLTAAYGW
jgi:phosphate transporter